MTTVCCMMQCSESSFITWWNEIHIYILQTTYLEVLMHQLTIISSWFPCSQLVQQELMEYNWHESAGEWHCALLSPIVWQSQPIFHMSKQNYYHLWINHTCCFIIAKCNGVKPRAAARVGDAPACNRISTACWFPYEDVILINTLNMYKPLQHTRVMQRNEYVYWLGSHQLQVWSITEASHCYQIEK